MHGPVNVKCIRRSTHSIYVLIFFEQNGLSSIKNREILDKFCFVCFTKTFQHVVQNQTRTLVVYTFLHGYELRLACKQQGTRKQIARDSHVICLLFIELFSNVFNQLCRTEHSPHFRKNKFLCISEYLTSLSLSIYCARLLQYLYIS